MRRLALTIIAALVSTTIATAQTGPLPERRLQQVADQDFFGGDLRALFEVTPMACHAACLDDAACEALTYNTAVNACFLKAGAIEPTAYVGAVSARVVAVPDHLRAQAEARAGDLTTLPPGTLAAAAELARTIGSSVILGDADLDTLRAEAETAPAERAVTLRAQTVVLTDDPAEWVALSQALRALRRSDSPPASDFATAPLSAAVNAYLRADAAPAQVAALVEIANALEASGAGAAAIPILRQAVDLSPDPETTAALERVRRLFGFRVVEHSVEADSARPRICVTFSEPLGGAEVDYAPFVRAGGPDLPVTVEEQRLCIGGVTHGARASVTLRKGLPSASGETLVRSVTIDAYVRDRNALVRFPGRGHVLARSGRLSVPLVGVNAPEAALRLFRIGPRGLASALRDNVIGRPLNSFSEERIAGFLGAPVWEGRADLAMSLNEDAVTSLPLGDTLGTVEPGIYALTARVPDSGATYRDAATQWITVTDVGLTTFRGTTGMTVVARRFSDAAGVSGATVTIIARNNAVLATAETDAEGVATVPPGLLAGTGGDVPALVTVETADDFAFLDLGQPAFDLSDRGVEGRAAPGPIDVFAHTDRGAYRPGETVHATILARDDRARAIRDLPLTARIQRPDGVIATEMVLMDQGAGGRTLSWDVPAHAMRGTWRLRIHVDPAAPALAESAILVEDFVPERIALDLTYPDGAVDPATPGEVAVSARFLYGAAGSGLDVTGDARIVPQRRRAEHPGYLWGRHDSTATPRSVELAQAKTDSAGLANLAVTLPETSSGDGLAEMTLAIRVRDASGRPVERTLSRPLVPDALRIGLRPLFDGAVPSGGTAAFDVLAIDGAGAIGDQDLEWTLSRVETEYQWFQSGGRWQWEPFTTEMRTAAGVVASGTGEPARIEAPVTWGRYVLSIAAPGVPGSETSVLFSAGWYTADAGTETPSRLDVALDASNYAPGDTATLRMTAETAGVALVSILADGVVDLKAVPVDAGENAITLLVTDAWSPGVYVTASLLASGDTVGSHSPVRAIGLAYAPVAPGDRRLVTRVEAPEQTTPRQTVTASVAVEGLAPGERAYVTLSAVDAGILNLTAHPEPDPDGWYLGQRRLGIDLRDTYGRLIDASAGAPGRLRSGGDGGLSRSAAPPPTEPLVAEFSGVVTADEAGRVDLPIPLPDFNGTVRVSAIAWSESGVGQATHDMLVRDPIVVATALPRLMRPGDTSRVLIEMTHVDGPAGTVRVRTSATEGLEIDSLARAQSIDLEESGRAFLEVPLTAASVGLQEVQLQLILPDNTRRTRTLPLVVQQDNPPVHRSVSVSLPPGGTASLDAGLFSDLLPGTGAAVVTAGPLARLDVPGALSRLSSYPYGCTEQTVSRALPLVLFPDAPGTAGGATAPQIAEAIGRILANQTAAGSFGLWSPGGGDLWLDAYVTDFLARARMAGHAVPEAAFDRAVDNLANAVAYAGDFEKGGEDIAFALMVLAREGRASIGDLRYYADARAEAFATPLALAQVGHALAAYGETARADTLFGMAAGALPRTLVQQASYRADYGSVLRDAAGVLALATEAGSTVVDAERLAARIALPEHSSTQELVWTLLAARALDQSPASGGLTVDGAPLTTPFLKYGDADTSAPRVLANTLATPTTLRIATSGVPAEAEPASGNGYAIERAYFTLDGEPVSPDTVLQNTRLVTVLTVTTERQEAARLMVDDPVPAGFEIDNPNLLSSGDIAALDWLAITDTAAHTEARADRFLAAIDWTNGGSDFRLAYIVRAVSPGRFHHPAALVEDMYRPVYRARSAVGAIEVVGAAE